MKPGQGVELTDYSRRVEGETCNHGWDVRFDVTTGGVVGITQFDGEKVSDRVLLSPKQVRELKTFLAGKRRRSL